MSATRLFTPVHTVCYHCGNECPDEALSYDDKPFCCEGCRTVYQLLSEHQLCQYYTLDGKGISPASTRFEFLDNPEIAESLLDFQNEQTARVTFFLPAIHCSSCLYLLEHLPRLNGAVASARVDFLKKQVVVQFRKDQLTLRQLAELLTSIGYEPLISLQDVVREQQQPSYRSLLTRIGVAGFCAGNIMLFSFPEYLGLDDPTYKVLFGWLSLILSLPVVFYSAQGYFVSVYKSLRAGRLNLDFPILLGIMVAWTRSVYEVVFLHQNGYFDSLTGLTFFLLAGRWFQEKTYSFLSFERDYQSYFPLSAQLVGNAGTTTPVPVRQLRKGNRIRIRHGELIPADGLLYRGTGRIDYSFVTGEASPETHTVGDLLYAGGRQTGDSIELEVLKEVSQSYLTQLWNDAAFTRKENSRLRTFADAVGNYFTISVLILATLAAAWWYFHDPSKALNAFTAVLIIACPCALALSYPFALGHGLRILGRQKFYLKNGEVLEKLAQCDTIVFDKTGTLTTTSGQELSFTGTELTGEERLLVASLVSHSTHPLSVQVYRHLQEPVPAAVADFTEVSGKGLSGTVLGHSVQVGSAGWVDAQPALPGGTRLFIRIDGTLKGHYAVGNTYREGLEPMLSQLGQQYTLCLLSGDGDAERPYLSRWFPEMHFRMKPEDKLQVVRRLQEEGRKVLMLGDGLNDAGAIRQADAGIALTENTLQFSPASDGILEAGELRLLPRFLQFSKRGLTVIRFSFIISLIYNLIGLSYGLTGNLSPVVAAILMPLSSATMVFIATLGMKQARRRYFPS